MRSALVFICLSACSPAPECAYGPVVVYGNGVTLNCAAVNASFDYMLSMPNWPLKDLTGISVDLVPDVVCNGMTDVSGATIVGCQVGNSVSLSDPRILAHEMLHIQACRDGACTPNHEGWTEKGYWRKASNFWAFGPGGNWVYGK